MQIKGKELIKQVKTLTKESDYNGTQNKNLETMIKHMDENLQMIVTENMNLRKEFNLKMTEKNEEIHQMRDIAEKIIHDGDMDLFNSILQQARGDSSEDNLQNSRFSSNKKSSSQGTQRKSNQPNSARHSSKKSSQSKVTKKKQRSPRQVNKEEEANLIMRIAELKRENASLRKQNSNFREQWLSQSITESNMENNELLLPLPKIPKHGQVDDDSIFFDDQTPISSLADERYPQGSFKTFTSNEGVYQDVKDKQKKGFRFRWKKKGQKYKQKERMREAEESLNRTTLRKTLGTRKDSARGRHARYAGEGDKDVYCALI